MVVRRWRSISPPLSSSPRANALNVANPADNSKHCPMRNPDSQDLQFVIDVLTGAIPWLRFGRPWIPSQETQDRKLRIYLNRVYIVLSSPAMKHLEGVAKSRDEQKERTHI